MKLNEARKLKPPKGYVARKSRPKEKFYQTTPYSSAEDVRVHLPDINATDWFPYDQDGHILSKEN